MKQITLVIASLAFLCAGCKQTPPATTNANPTPDAGLARLQDRLAQIAAKSDGVTGVSALHIETGRRVAVRGGEWFPQASVRKLPVALAMLARVERGEENLERVVELKPSDIRTGVDAAARWQKRGNKFPLREFLEYSIIQSDNTAMDVTLKAGGGLAEVMKFLRERGVTDVDVSRDSRQLSADYNGLAQPPPEAEYTLEKFEKLAAAAPQERKKAAQIRMESDQRDSATPDGMTDLLAKLFRGQLLQPAMTALMLDIMRRTETGPGRLKGLLPAGTEVAHKTGTFARACNDAGLIYLPEGKGHIAISVFSKATTANDEAKERIIAELARAVYDEWVKPAGSGQ
jgi:beta-lactamase class A